MIEYKEKAFRLQCSKAFQKLVAYVPIIALKLSAMN